MAKRTYFLDNIAVALGGRVAEELVFGDVSNGAAMDIQQLTQMARSMVTQLRHEREDGAACSLASRTNWSFWAVTWRNSATTVRKWPKRSTARCTSWSIPRYARVRKLLTDNISKLHGVANALLERETLNAEEFEEVFSAA